MRSRKVGISTFYRLMAEHGSASAAMDALPDLANKAGLSKYQPCSQASADAEIAQGAKIGAQLICRGEAHYPSLLGEISDAPPMIWVRGALDVLKRPMIALVGARNASSLGTRMARALASDLSDQGYVVVSGLARGIDTCAHLAAAEGGSIAVLAGGVDVIYPNENLDLADKLMVTGALV
ncbi:DNA-processing protein DprA, partial [Planktotalea sp.]|uniref:DNA-processing protein DprA n=1 Tax=Planktotalea sp. TaxID=2029877 RepID=UPI003298E789